MSQIGTDKMRAACVQMCSGTNRAENLAACEILIRDAAAKGASLVATPEMTSILQKRPRLLMAALPDPDQPLSEIDQFSALAKELQITLLIGSMAVALAKEPGVRRAANRSFLFAPDGRLITTYDKIHMFDVDLPNGESWKESAIYQPGEALVVADIGVAKLGLSICYDLRFPQLYRRLAQAGADILMVPAAFTKPTGAAHWEVLLRARAIETGSFVLAPAQGGQHEDGRETYGGSMIINPWGEVLAAVDGDEPGVIMADLDIAQVAKTRMQIPSLALTTNPSLRQI